MAKVRSQFVCQSCGSSFPQWLGQCPSCRDWNTLVEEVRDRVELVLFAVQAGLVEDPNRSS